MVSFSLEELVDCVVVRFYVVWLVEVGWSRIFVERS